MCSPRIQPFNESFLNDFRYEERIDRVETRITARLRDQLGTAKNAAEMFRIFSRFNALFVRPHIRGAIREYQTQLIQRVKDDIEALHEKFKIQYPQSKAYKMSGVRDLPPVAGSIIWARQIDRQLRYDFEKNSTKIASVLISLTLNLITPAVENNVLCMKNARTKWSMVLR